MKSLTLAATLTFVASTAAASSPKACPDEIAANLLLAITSRNEASIKAIANNPKVMDQQTIQYLIGDASFKFPKRDDLRSAYLVLKGKKVLTKVVTTELSDGSKSVDAIFLPTDTAADFVDLAEMAKKSRVAPFRNYVMCNIVIENGVASMPHACYAETDALD